MYFTVRNSNCFARPELLNELHLLDHEFLAASVVAGRERKIIRLPTGGEGNADATVGKIVHNRPFLSDANGVMQRQDHTSGMDFYTPSDGGDRGTGDGRVGI